MSGAGESIEFLSAVLLVSKDPERLAAYYREVVGIPLEEEEHGETLKHYGCTLGDLHFAVHPAENFQDEDHGVGAVKLAFTVFDMDAFVRRITAMGVELLYPPRDVGFAVITALRDPDGNYLELTQLSDGWFEHLEERKGRGIDVVSRWKSHRSKEV